MDRPLLVLSGEPEKLGVSNTSYGANLAGDVCVTAPDNDANPHITTPNGQPRPSTDRQPSDAMTVDDADLHRQRQRPLDGAPAAASPSRDNRTYGPNLISRWKGRAFQSSPDSSVSVVGFEDEQTNWELNSSLLGWKVGPVRAIREVWGADSGTNVTKVEIYYRDSYTYQYHVRVHPIPTDGLYTSWDFNYGNVSTLLQPAATSAACPSTAPTATASARSNSLPVTGQPAFVNSCDPTYDICSALYNPEEIAGPHGSLVYIAGSAVEPVQLPARPVADPAVLHAGEPRGGSVLPRRRVLRRRHRRRPGAAAVPRRRLDRPPR